MSQRPQNVSDGTTQMDEHGNLSSSLLRSASSAFQNPDEVHAALENLVNASKELERVCNGAAKVHCVMIRTETDCQEVLHPLFSSVLPYALASTNPCAPFVATSIVDAFSIAREAKNALLQIHFNQRWMFAAIIIVTRQYPTQL